MDMIALIQEMRREVVRVGGRHLVLMVGEEQNVWLLDELQHHPFAYQREKVLDMALEAHRAMRPVGPLTKASATVSAGDAAYMYLVSIRYVTRNGRTAYLDAPDNDPYWLEGVAELTLSKETAKDNAGQEGS